MMEGKSNSETLFFNFFVVFKFWKNLNIIGIALSWSMNNSYLILYIKNPSRNRWIFLLIIQLFLKTAAVSFS